MIDNEVVAPRPFKRSMSLIDIETAEFRRRMEMTALEVSGDGPRCASPATCGRLGIHVSSCPLHPGYAVSAGKKPPCDNCGQIVVGEFQRCTNCHKEKRILCESCVLCWDCNSTLQQKQSEEAWDRWMLDTGSASSLVETSTSGQNPRFQLVRMDGGL